MLAREETQRGRDGDTGGWARGEGNRWEERVERVEREEEEREEELKASNDELFLDLAFITIVVCVHSPFIR